MIKVVIVGLESGLAYALIALSLALLFKTSGVLNFAQGTISGFAGFLTYWWITSVGLPWFAGAAAAILCLIAFAICLERVAVRPLLASGFFPIVIATLAVNAGLGNAIERMFGTTPLPLEVPWKGTAFTVAGMRISNWTVVLALTALVVLGVVSYLVQKTDIGISMRAFADDQVAARLMGVSQAKISRITWVLSLTVAAIVGIVLAPALFLQPGYMEPTFIYGLTAAVLGGFTSLGGAVIGGILLGQIQSIAISYAPEAFTSALPMLVVLAVLLIRPNGLFARSAPVSRV